MAEKDDWVKKSEEFDQLALTFMKKHKYPKALRLFRLSAAIAEEEEARLLPGAYNNRAVVHNFMGENELAMLYFEQSWEGFRNLCWLDRIFDQQFALALCW